MKIGHHRAIFRICNGVTFTNACVYFLLHFFYLHIVPRELCVCLLSFIVSSLFPVQNEQNGIELDSWGKRRGFCSWVSSSGKENPRIGQRIEKTSKSAKEAQATQPGPDLGLLG